MIYKPKLEMILGFRAFCYDHLDYLLICSMMMLLLLLFLFFLKKHIDVLVKIEQKMHNAHVLKLDPAAIAYILAR